MNGNEIRRWIISEMTNHGVSEEELASLTGLGRAQVQACLQGGDLGISEETLHILDALDLELVVRPRPTPSERRVVDSAEGHPG